MRNTFGIAGIAALTLAVALLFDGAALAEETGVAGIHAWVKVGRKTCLADHFHDGTGAGATRRQAQAEAISSWSGFTAWEYGSTWGRYGIAVDKSMSCSSGSGGVTCNVSARPCRPY